MTSSIPIQRLPFNAIRLVIGQLYKCDFNSLIFFSTCSTKSKLLVKIMKLKVNQIEVNLRNGCFITFPYRTKYSILNPTGSTNLGTLTPCQLTLPESSIVMSKPSVREWIDHFLFIFNKRAIDLQFGFFETWKYCLESIHMLLKGLDINCLDIDFVEEEKPTFDILGLFPLVTNLNMGVYSERLEPDVSEANFNQLKKIIIGNMTEISLRQNIPIDLDTLLMMNGVEINLSSPKLSDRDLNMFFKLWIKGSNPRLEILHCFYPAEQSGKFAECIMLKGIQYTKQPSNLSRFFQPKPNVTMKLEGGGYDIWRIDGTIATFFFERNYFAMYVWLPTNTCTADDSFSEF